MRINHLHLHVASVERAADFYARHFGFRPHAWHGEVLFMRDAGDFDLALAPGRSDELPAWFHFGVRLQNAAEVRAAYDRLRSEGVAMREPLTDEGELIYFRCVDPDGHGIEIYWEVQPDGPPG